MSAVLETLRARLGALPEALQRSFEAPLIVPRELARARRIHVTGVGSSASHARYLIALLQETGRAAGFTPLSRFAGGLPAGAEDDGLIVFSQGLSPNARLALRRARGFASAVAIAGAAGLDDERRRFLDEHAIALLDTGADREAGALVRLAGPVLAYATALRVAAELGAEPIDATAVPDAVARVLGSAPARWQKLPDPAFRGPFLLATLGVDPATRDNLRLKLAEGLLATTEPLVDLLDVTHGPFQRLCGGPATWLILTERDDPARDLLEARLAQLLEPEHLALPIEATLGGALSIFEHEAALGAFVVEGLARRGADPGVWPGQGRDGPLYDLDAIPGQEPVRQPRPDEPAAVARVGSGHRLEALTSPEVAARRAGGVDTVVLPLGSTEQHGPALPLATDTWIAEAVAERLCRKLGNAVWLPALPFGCASEHLAFPGTLHVEAATLEALLTDLLASVAHHGFRRAFVFTAHGGNLELLRQAGARLSGGASDLDVACFVDHRGLAQRLHEVASRFGVTPEASGHHAGELETSILLGLAPHALRRERAEAGFVEPDPDTHALFYPSLRDHAPNGVVGDPRSARAERAESYLDAWAAWLADDAKKRRWTKGTKNA